MKPGEGLPFSKFTCICVVCVFFFWKMLLDIVIVQCCSITSTVEQLSLVLDVVEAMMTTDPQEKPRSKNFPFCNVSSLHTRVCGVV